jgi:hypothetical protein
MTDFLRKTTYSYASNGHSTTKYDIRRHHCDGKINPYCWRETAWIFQKIIQIDKIVNPVVMQNGMENTIL